MSAHSDRVGTDAATRTVVEALLFAPSTSPPPATDATLTIDEGAFAATFACSVMGG
jgi:hypothetical protein